MDSLQAILPDALRVNANLFQTDLCRGPGCTDANSQDYTPVAGYIPVLWIPAVHARYDGNSKI
ncbi:MAG: hypothetical protein ACU88J_11905 [Gammaproteobacteria bacterium]